MKVMVDKSPLPELADKTSGTEPGLLSPAGSITLFAAGSKQVVVFRVITPERPGNGLGIDATVISALLDGFQYFILFLCHSLTVYSENILRFVNQASHPVTEILTDGLGLLHLQGEESILDRDNRLLGIEGASSGTALEDKTCTVRERLVKTDASVQTDILPFYAAVPQTTVILYAEGYQTTAEERAAGSPVRTQELDTVTHKEDGGSLWEYNLLEKQIISTVHKEGDTVIVVGHPVHELTQQLTGIGWVQPNPTPPWQGQPVVILAVMPDGSIKGTYFR